MKIGEKQEKIIIELIKDARVSDTRIAQKTGIPLKTVNRLRKQLEENNYLSYFTYFKNPKPNCIPLTSMFSWAFMVKNPNIKTINNNVKN